MENDLPQTNDTSTETPDLNVNDLANIRSIIDAAVRRGTFTAKEISGVGAAYDKLDKFLTSIESQKQQ
jgi:hypothetical protein